MDLWGGHNSIYKSSFFRPSLEEGCGDSMMPLSLHPGFLEGAGALVTDIQKRIVMTVFSSGDPLHGLVSLCN